VPPGGKGSQWPRTLPEHSSCTFAQLMLLHGAGWPNHLLWEHWQAAHPPGSLGMFVHMKVCGWLVQAYYNRGVACVMGEGGVVGAAVLMSTGVGSACNKTV
jgi:hypothetical protein